MGKEGCGKLENFSSLLAFELVVMREEIRGSGAGKYLRAPQGMIPEFVGSGEIVPGDRGEGT